MEPLKNCGECLDEIMSHPWLKDINIDEMTYKVIPPPFMPTVDESETMDALSPVPLEPKESAIPVDKALSKDKDHLYFRKFETKP